MNCISPQNFSRGLVSTKRYYILFCIVFAASSGFFFWVSPGQVYNWQFYAHTTLLCALPPWCQYCTGSTIAKERNLLLQLCSSSITVKTASLYIKVTPLIFARGKERKDACNFRLHLEAPFIFCEALPAFKTLWYHQLAELISSRPHKIMLDKKLCKHHNVEKSPTNVTLRKVCQSNKGYVMNGQFWLAMLGIFMRHFQTLCSLEIFTSVKRKKESRESHQ